MPVQSFKHPSSIAAALEGVREQLGPNYDQTVSLLTDRDRFIEDALHQWLQRYAVRVTTTVGTSVANGATTKIVFNTITHQDLNGSWRTATNDYLVPHDGLYVVYGTWYCTGGGNRLIPILFRNTVREAYGMFDFHGVNSEKHYGVYAEFNAFKGDTIDLRVENTSGAGTATGGANAGVFLPYMTIHRAGPKAITGNIS